MRRTVNWKTNEIIRDVISALVLLLFFYTGLSKLVNRVQFKDVLNSSPLLKEHSALLAWAIPVTDIVLAVMLFIPATRLKGLYGTLAIMFVFTLYLGWMVRYAEQLPCNCGGISSSMNWNEHVVFNLLVIGLIVAGILSDGIKKNRFYHSPP